MNVAVAGGTGFVGGGIAEALVRAGHDVVVLTRHPDRARRRVPEAIDLRAADVSDAETLGAALDGVEALVIALAFHGYPMENPRRGETFEAVDAAGTERLVSAAVATGVRRLVYISGAGAAPDAAAHWFRAKWRAEEAVRGSGIAYTILRPTWLFGPRDVALNRFLGFARWLPFVPVTGDGRQELAPVFIDDVGAIVADSLTNPSAADRVFDVGGPETMSMNDVIRTALRVTGRRRFLLHAPARLLKVVAWPLQFLPRPPLTPDAIDFVNQPAIVDTRPLLQAMPRRLTTLEEGLRTYLGPRRERGSAALEVALAVPVVDDRVVDLLLVAGRVEVVVDDVLAEDLDRRLAPLELADRLVQRARHPRIARRDVAVALELGRELAARARCRTGRRRPSRRRSGTRSCRRPGSGSRRAAFGPCPTTRKPVVRLSRPQTTFTGAHDSDAYRLYELTIGAMKTRARATAPSSRPRSG